MTAPPFDAPEVHALAELAAHYDVRGELGRGGSAVVYRARDRHLDRDVALKVVRLAHARSAPERARDVARLAREARTIARLAHPHIVTVYAVHELADGLAVAMQCVHGGTLKQRIADEGALPPDAAVRLVCDVAAALGFAHAHGIVHRDVKPENIFIDEATGRALLADFGAARADSADVRVTRTGVTVGTPAYMSPEQVDGSVLDGRSDLYGLGLVAWEALTGERPWADAGLYQLLHHHKHDAPPPIGAVRPAGAAPVPPAVVYTIERLLEKRPGARWASAEDVVRQLERPVLPANYRTWKRAYDRRVADARRRGADVRASTPAADAPTAQWDSTLAPAAATIDDGPSPADGAARTRQAWYVGGTVAALALVGAALARATRPDAPVVFAGRSAVADHAPTIRVTPVPAARVSTPTPAPPTPNAAAHPGRAAAPEPSRVAAAVPAARDDASHPASSPAVGTRTGPPVSGPPVSGPSLSGRPTSPPPALTSPARQSATLAAAAPVPATHATPAPPAANVAAGPVAVAPDRTIIAAGARHSCALDDGGRAVCWGDNASGQLGAGDLTPRDTPTPVAGELRFVQLATGGTHSCGLTPDGDAYCWGDDDAGQLGDATTSMRDAPVRVAGTTRFRALRGGLEHTCGLTAAGAVLCWGANASGQLGDGTTRPRATPVIVAGLRATALATGWRHTCALTADGAAFCWGENSAGQLGDGSRSPRTSPTPVAGGLRFVAIAAGASHTCASTRDGATYCWGTNGTDAGAHAAPVRLDGAAPFVALVAGGVHTCGRTTAGAVYCWGRNAYGQLGDGSTTDRWRPTRVGGGPYTALAAAGAHTCAVATAPLCWGYNVSGQLGDGTRSHRATPTHVQTSRTG